MSAATLRFGSLSIEGASRAAEGTWFRVHPPGLAFDVGRGALQLAGAEDVFLSHGHLDHALGLPFVLSMRSLAQGTTRVYCPREIVEEVGAFIEAASRIEASTYAYQLRGLEPGARIQVGRDLTVEAFDTDHVVPSLGYHLIRHSKRLAEGYRGLDGAELSKRRKAGEKVEDRIEHLWLTFCGDTGPGVFELEPRVLESEILLVECTFVGEEARDKGEKYGHMHLEDLAEWAGEFKNEAIVLHHLSQRHRSEDLRAEIDRLMPELAERIHLFS